MTNNPKQLKDWNNIIELICFRRLDRTCSAEEFVDLTEQLDEKIKSAVVWLKKELHYIKENGERCEYGRICGKIDKAFEDVIEE